MSYVAVVNDFEYAPSTLADDLDVGTWFLGTVADDDGDDVTGLFCRVSFGLYFLDNADLRFSTEDHDVKIEGYREVDVTVTVDELVEG